MTGENVVREKYGEIVPHLPLYTGQNNPEYIDYGLLPEQLRLFYQL